MRINENGQVTIPLAIRKALGLLPNTEVTVVVVDGEVRLRKSGCDISRGDQIIRRLRSVRRDNGLTTDDITTLMRGKR